MRCQLTVAKKQIGRKVISGCNPDSTGHVKAAWSVIYPLHSVVVPKPTMFIPVGHAVAKGNDELLTPVNAVLMLAEANGTIDTNYEYWMLGGAAKSARPPRWSVIKNVLKWVD